MRQTWSITIAGLNDAQAAQAALLALDEAGFSTGVHLSAIMPYAGNETTIYHWCDHAMACATADRLAEAGLDARVTENLPG